MARHRRPAPGSPPGALATGGSHVPAELRLYVFDADNFEERPLSVADLDTFERPTDRVMWVEVIGLDDVPTVEAVGRKFAVHPLALADAVNTPQRPKMEAYDEHVLLISQMVRPSSHHGFTVEQLAIVIGQGFVLSFQERDYGDVLDPVRQRLRAAKGVIRRHGADHLAYALLDTVIDGYYPVLEQLGEALESLESRVIHDPEPHLLAQLQKIKRQLLALRRGLWPQREAVSMLLHERVPCIAESTLVYFRDCYDHAIQLMDVLETYREISSSLVDAYLSSLSNRLNEVMKVLALISTIFMPLSFIAGVYGMNFKHMPELAEPWAYPAVLGLMGATAAGLITWFARRRWIPWAPERLFRSRGGGKGKPAKGSSPETRGN